MRYQTERDRIIHEATLEMRAAAHAQDLEAFQTAHGKLSAAKASVPEHECVCGKKWAGDGVLAVCFVSAYEQDPETDEKTWIAEYDRGHEHYLMFCPDCKERIKALMVLR